MAVIETWFNQDLQEAVKTRYLDGNMFSNNGNGNRIGVNVTNGGEPVTLSGTVSGYVLISDGSTVPCTGIRSGNQASILIPPAAYQPGNIFISIFLTDGTTVTTLAAVATSVIQARTDTQVDPGSVVTDWTNTINAALQTVEGYTGNIIATPYASLTYPVPLGKYCIYNNLLYRCISPIASSESWTSSHWTQVKLADDVSDLKSAFTTLLKLPYTQILNKGFNKLTGATPDENNWDITSRIPVNAGEKLYVFNGSKASSFNGFYRIDGAYIANSYFNVPIGNFNEVTVPSDAAFMLLSNSHANFDYIVYRCVHEYVLQRDFDDAEHSIDANTNGVKAGKENLYSMMYSGKTNNASNGYIRGTWGLLTGNYEVNYTTEMVDMYKEPLLLEADSITVHVKSGYRVRGVILNPDKTYKEYFATWSTGGSISYLQNRRGYYVKLIVAKADGSSLSDSEVASAGIDTAWLEENHNVSGGLESLVKDSSLWGKTYETLSGAQNVKDIADIIPDKYLYYDTGVIADDVATYNIAKIELTHVTNLFIAYTNAAMLSYEAVAYYDANMKYISGEEPELSDASEKVEYNGYYGTYYTIPAGAVYAIINLAKGRDDIRYLVAVCDGFVHFSGVTIPSYLGGKSSPFVGKKIVNFGDSIFGNFRDANDTTDKSISKMIAEALGATVYNAGFGGCRMTNHSNAWDAFSMYRLADSIANTADEEVSEPWSVQEAALVTGAEYLPSYFSQTVTMLKGIDWSEIDYITIGYGVNDYTANRYITGEEQGQTFAYEWNYYEGALRYSLRKILGAYPQIRIAVVTPCWMFWDEVGAENGSSDIYENSIGYVLPDYVNACKSVCDQYHVGYIDTYYTLGFNPYSWEAYFYAADGTHPNYIGRQLRADRISGQLIALYCH